MDHSDLTRKDSASLPNTFIGNTGRGSPAFSLPAQITATSSLNEILAFARKENASDVHLSAEKPLIFRQFGVLKHRTTKKLSAAHIRALISTDLPQDVVQNFENSGDAEYVHTIAGYGRFRMTLIKHRSGYDLTARVIPMEIPTFAQTGMPESCSNLTNGPKV